jgi:cytochrome c
MNRASSLALVIVSFIVSIPVHANEELAKSKGCLNCHAIDQKRVGPSYKDVAAKYAGQSDAADKLAAKIIAGGAGTWGAMPMPPNPQLAADDAKKLAQWVLGIK